jgi:hypothetical protein
MSKQKTSPSVTWFDGQKVDARIALYLCLAMIQKCLKSLKIKARP